MFIINETITSTYFPKKENFLEKIEEIVKNKRKNEKHFQSGHQNPTLEFTFQYYSKKDEDWVSVIKPTLLHTLSREFDDFESKRKEIITSENTQKRALFLPKYVGIVTILEKSAIIQYLYCKNMANLEIHIIDFDQFDKDQFNWVPSAKTGFFGPELFNKNNDQFFIDLSKYIPNNKMILLHLPKEEEQKLNHHALMDYKIQEYHQVIDSQIRNILDQFTNNPSQVGKLNFLYMYRKENNILLFSKPDTPAQRKSRLNIISLIKSKEKK